MARSYIGREIVKRGGSPELRQGFTTDNGNLVLDCHGLTILNPPELEADLNNLAGVVANGIFARRPADVVLVAETSGNIAVIQT
jgi:ribose 5-phosphate isomerase A